MAVKIKGSKVIGTKKKDKITWKNSGAWRKPLTVKAKAGNDVINFVKSPFKKNKLYGEGGNDKIYGSMNTDYIYGGSGNDTIVGNLGNDRIYAGAGRDIIDGGKGNDKIWGESGANAIAGGVDNDTIFGSTGFDAIAGGKGDDVIKLAAFAEASNTITFTLNETLSKEFGVKTVTLDSTKRTYVSGGAGNDKIYNIKGGAYVDGGSGKDTITAVSGNNTLFGGSDNDSITGGTGDDSIDGGSKNDTIIATAGGNNTILGGSGLDSITAGAGDDSIDGGISNDTINAGDGNNTVYGGSGADSIICGSGNDEIYGGQQNDTINAGGGNNIIHHGSEEGEDVIISGGGNDTIVFDGITNITPGYYDGNDYIINVGPRKMTLKDFGSGNHSVKAVDIGGVETEIYEFINGSRSSSVPPVQKGATLRAVTAGWLTEDDGYVPASKDAGLGGKEQDPGDAIIAASTGHQM